MKNSLQKPILCALLLIAAIVAQAQSPITVTAKDEIIDFGQTPVLAYEITSGSLEDGDELTGSLEVDNLNIGTHTITQGTLTAGEDYDITYVEATLTVRSVNTAIDNLTIDWETIRENYITTLNSTARVAVSAEYALISINNQPDVSSGIPVIVSLNYGENLIPIVVTAQNGNSQTHTLVIERYYDQIIYEYPDVPTINCNPQTNGGYTFTDFQWYRNDVAIGKVSNSFYPYYQIKDNASYYCKITVSDGSQWRTDDIQASALRSATLIAYPNPTNGELRIENLQIDDSQLIQVFDMNGALMLQTVENPFDVSALSNGVYLVKANGETMKVVKK